RPAFSIYHFPGPTSDNPAVSFGYPVIDRLGQLQGVVFATLDLNWGNRFGSELSAQLPKEATWTELDQNGDIIVRYPAAREWTGQPLPEKSLLKTVRSGSKGIVETFDADGIPAFYAYSSMRSRLVRGNVITLLGVPKQVLFAGADRALSRDLAWSGLAAGLALMLGWLGSNLLVLRPVKALVRS